ncbi:M16 family metallopeptidase [Mangrovibacterium diazotrophicum]|uniref:Putative Zn-dependent peptidase n=1 Tax=Mangrovibacterium diazotrophicum TaxID=1261403 RepID=A0A419VYY2_9BACT|nr:pitrilysin family protein [Mangrovibacterium diazotrophicum]RKD88426.1 putative Zn-dependent peptidase [Mangrovibacterium diazotrophicum]
MMPNRLLEPALHKIEKPDLIHPAKSTLRNGIPVFALKAGQQEVCKIDFVFEAGIWQQQKPLLASLSNAMLQEGSKNYTAAQIAEFFDFHGAYLQLTADYHNGTVSVITLEKHVDKLLPVIEDLIKHSIFPSSEFQTLLKRRKQRFLLETEKVKILCQKKFSEVLFGQGHPYTLGLKAEDFDNGEIEDFVRFYKQHYHSKNCEIHLSGQFSDSIVDSLDKYFGSNDWEGQATTTETKEIIATSEALVRINKENAIQSAIRIGKLLVEKQHPDYFGLQILTTILGGYFSSRLMMNIREDKGYTYGIGANFVSLNQAGYLIITTEVDKQYEKDTLKEIKKEIDLLRTKLVSEEELNRVKQYLVGEFLREFDGPFSLSQAFRNIHDFNLDYSFYDKYYETIQSITPQHLQNLALKYLSTESMHTVIAG